jgi:alanyl-tRNA synthetase
MLKVATERLYYSDAYLTEFQAQVVDISSDGRRVYLDRTAFYPSSGGQPFDLGFIGDNEVIEVVDEDDRVAHVLSTPTGVGPLTGRIDWARRFDHMQQHTGQHLLSAVLDELFGFPTLSFHMGEDVSSIEIGVKELADKQVDEAEARVNDLARGGPAVHISFQDAEQVAGLRKQSERQGLLRIIEIEGIDKSACGGTHVRSLEETLPLQIRRLDKVRGNVRLEFVCGGRATKRAKQDYCILQELARQSATPMDRLPEVFATIKQRLSDAEKDLERMARDLAQRQGRELYAQTQARGDGIRRVLWNVEQIDETVRAKALAFTGGAQSIVLAVGKQPAGVLIACSSDAGINAGAILKQTLAEFGGKGGGAATLAQGNLPDPNCALALAAKLGL